MIPCRKNKCLLQAVCRTKSHITCDDLMTYVENKYKARSQSSNSSFSKLHRKIWVRINKNWPKLKSVISERHKLNEIQYYIKSPLNIR